MSCCSEKMEPLKTESCCTPQDSAHQASQAMRKSGCGCSPVVVDKASRKVVGVVTERDLSHKVVAEDRKPSKVLAAEIMTPVSACCHKDDSLDEAHRKLNEHRTTSLPVVDSAGDCCGTISAHHLSA